jgi:transposase
VPEVRRLLLALQQPPARFSFHLAWSRWRRHHQAVARRGHSARRARAQPPPVSGPVTEPAESGPRSAELTEAQWARVAPLLPPQKPRTGRPAHDHRRIVAGMVWMERTGASWRALPAHFGPWQTVYSRYHRWCKMGLWSRIKDVLAQTEQEQKEWALAA